jgi:hypothetical protein
VGSHGDRRARAAQRRAASPVERELAQIEAAAVRQTPEAAQVAVRCSVARGPAGPVLVAEADGAALLIVGSHGHLRIHELLFGSTSSYCARHATCPVVVIPSAMATQRELGATSSPRGFVATGHHRSATHNDWHNAMRQLPEAHSLALRLRDARLADELIAECLALNPQALDPLLNVAEANLAAILGGQRGR